MATTTNTTAAAKNASQMSRSLSSAIGGGVKRTALYDFHVNNGGKMVPFAGYEMPVLYTGDLSIKDSHLHTRSGASLFDVSHMLQMEIYGKDRIEFIESLVVADVASMGLDEAALTLYTNDAGGIIDDLIVTRRADRIYIVSNAACAQGDLEHLNKARENFLKNHANAEVTFKILSDSALIALQGPKAMTALNPLVDVNLQTLKFMKGINALIGKIPVRITRCGYTGEDGFEVCMPNEEVEAVAKLLIKSSVKLAGLGARDSLRLEAGLCLYGNDIDATTTPIEAGLAWTIAKPRRAAANFPGASIILNQLKEKPKRRRVGLVGVAGGPPVRHEANVFADKEGSTKIGSITSGCPSPSLGKNIAMAYVPTPMAKLGTKVFCDVRGKLYEYEVAKMPFVSTKYFV